MIDVRLKQRLDAAEVVTLAPAAGTEVRHLT